jgi:thiamine-monophosphate kinase
VRRRGPARTTAEVRIAPQGELELIRRVRARLREAGADRSARLALGSGDDAAVVDAEGATAVSVDAMVEGVHFRLETASPRSVGRKALAAALSDLAAVGAAPTEAYVALGVPGELAEEACLELIDGFVEGAAEWSATLAGGDVTASPVLFASVTVVGELADADAAVRRDGASPGEAVAVTGELGGAAAGLLLLERPALAAEVPDALAERLRDRQLDPAPRLEAGQVLARCGATAMIDLSDGLGADAGHLARASGTRLDIDLPRVPVADGVAAVAAAAGVDPVELAVSRGEDYELLACLPPDAVAPAARALAEAGTELTVIGSVAEGEGEAVLRGASGEELPAKGYEHLGAGDGRP